MHLTSSTFGSTVRFSVDAIPPALQKETPNEPCCWGNYPRGAAFALHTKVPRNMYTGGWVGGEGSAWGVFVRVSLLCMESVHTQGYQLIRIHTHTQGYHLTKGITGHIVSPEGLDSSGISSSAAVGVAYLLALQAANDLHDITPADTIELDRCVCVLGKWSNVQ